jgi:hypothetical protein
MPRVIVGIRRQVGFAATCNCGAATHAPTAAGAVSALIEHVGTAHPDFLAEFLGEIAPPCEYTAETITVPAFVRLMHAMLAMPEPGRPDSTATAPRTVRPQGQRSTRS